MVRMFHFRAYFSSLTRIEAAGKGGEGGRVHGIWSILCSQRLKLSNLLLLLSFSICKHMSGASRTILSNFFEEQCPQSHPKYLSGLSRALFRTTFLEIAVYGEALPRDPTPYTFINHFSCKRYPFRLPSFDKWYQFHRPYLELRIPFNCCNCTDF